MRANRPKLARARKLAEEIEIQSILGVDVTVLLDAHQAMGRPMPWWKQDFKRQAPAPAGDHP